MLFSLVNLLVSLRTIFHVVFVFFSSSSSNNFFQFFSLPLLLQITFCSVVCNITYVPFHYYPSPSDINLSFDYKRFLSLWLKLVRFLMKQEWKILKYIFKNLLKEVLASSSIKISSQFSWLSSNWNSSILWSLMSLFVVILFILFCKNNIFYHYYLCLVNRKRIDMGIYNIIFSISQHKFATGSKSTVPCAAGYCMVKNHTIT